MARYATDTWISGSVSAGATLDTNRTSLPSQMNIVKVKVVPNTTGGTFDFKIYRKNTFLAADLLALWEQVSGTLNLYDPMNDSSGSPIEANEGPGIPYVDSDASGQLHIRIINNDSGAHTYAVDIEYEKVVNTITGTANQITASASNGDVTLSFTNGVTGTATTAIVLATSPTLVTPVLGVASATSINRITLTTPATGSTLTLIDGKTLIINKTISFTAADDTGVYTLPTGTKTLVATDVATLSSLTSIGTIGTGVWQGTVIAGLYGGTGLSTAAIGDLIYASATTPTWARLADVAANKVLLSGGVNTAPAYSSWTHAAPGTSGNVLTSDGTNWTSAAAAGITGTLTSGRIPIATGASTISDDSDLTFLTDTLTVTNAIISTTLKVNSGGVAINGGSNAIAFGGSTAGGVFRFTGSFTNGAGIFTDPTITVPTNSPGHINYLCAGGTLVEDSAGTHSIMAGTRCGPATITAGGAAVTIAATLYLDGVTTAVGASSHSLYINSASVRWAGYGSGAATFDANGNITSVSDERLKTNITPLEYGLSEIIALDPIEYNWTKESGLDTKERYVSVKAQAAQQVMPLAVGKMNDCKDEKGFACSGNDSYLTLNPFTIMYAMVNAFKEVEQRLALLEAKING